MVATGLLALGVLAAAMAVVNMASANVSAALRTETEITVQRYLEQVGTQPYVDLVAGAWETPDACDDDPDESCLSVRGHNLRAGWALNTGIDASQDGARLWVDVTATVPLADGAAPQRDGTGWSCPSDAPCLERTYRVPTRSLSAALGSDVVVRATTDYRDDLPPVTLVDSAGVSVSETTTFSERGVALLTTDAGVCTDADPCRVALSDGPAWWTEDGWTLSATNTVGPSHALTLPQGSLTDVALNPSPTGDVAVTIAAQPQDGDPVTGAEPGSVCLTATFDDDAGARTASACNDPDGSTVVFDTYTAAPGIDLPLAAGTALDISAAGDTSGPTACPSTGDLGQVGFDSAIWTPASVCTTWTWGLPTLVDTDTTVTAGYPTLTTVEVPEFSRESFTLIWSGDQAAPAVGTSGLTGLYDQRVFQDQPTAFWRFGDDPTGTGPATDSVDEHPGTYSAGATPTASGLTDSARPALSVAGGGHVLVPSHPDLHGQTFTFETWVSADTIDATTRTVMSTRDSTFGPQGASLTLSSADTWQLHLGTGASWTILDGPAAQVDEPTHLVGTFDGTIARLYVDGQLADATPTSYDPASGGLTIGTSSDPAGSQPFSGTIDDTAVYHHPAAAASVRQRAAQVGTLDDPTFAGVVTDAGGTLWTFDTPGPEIPSIPAGPSAWLAGQPDALQSSGVGTVNASTHLDGGASAIHLPVGTLGDSFTVETWVRPDDLTSGTVFWSGEDGSGFGPDNECHITHTAVWSVYCQTDGTVHVPLTVAGTVTAGAWHHVAFAIDDSTWNLTVDGNSIANGTTTGTIDTSNYTAAYLGRPGDVSGLGGERRFAGQVAQAALFPTALDQFQLTEHFRLTAGIVGDTLLSQDPAAWWPLNDLGTDARDRAGSLHAAGNLDEGARNVAGPRPLPSEQATAFDTTSATTGPASLLEADQSTYALWVKPTSAATGTPRTLITKGAGAPALELHPDDLRVEARHATSGADVTLTSTEELSRDRWTHVALVTDTDTGDISLYVDGQVTASTNDPDLLAVPDSAPIELGGDSGYQLAHPTAYTRTLAPTTVALLAAAGQPIDRYDRAAANLSPAAWWQLSDPTNVVRDTYGARPGLSTSQVVTGVAGRDGTTSATRYPAGATATIADRPAATNRQQLADLAPSVHWRLTDTQPYVTGLQVTEPAAYWTLGDPPASNVAADRSGNQTDGVYTDGPVRSVLGALNRAGNATAFTAGTNERVVINTVPAITDELTIGGWIQTTDPADGTLQGIWGQGTGGNLAYDLSITPAGSLQFQLARDGDTTLTVTSTTTLTADTWHHIAISYDGQNACVHLDGDSDCVAGAGQIAGSTADLVLGRTASTDHAGLTLNHVSFHTSALPANQLARLAALPATLSAADVSGDNRDGRYVGLHVAPVGGPNVDSDAGAARFDGDNYVTGNHNYATVGALPTVSVTAWVKLDSDASGIGTLVDYDSAAYFSLTADQDANTVAFTTTAQDGTSHVLPSTGTLTPDEWHHVVAVYDGTDVHLYIDGQTDTSVINPHGGQALGTGDTRYATLGAARQADTLTATGAAFHLEGDLADAAVTADALSAADVSSLYASGAGTETGTFGLANYTYTFWLSPDSAPAGQLRDVVNLGTGDTNPRVALNDTDNRLVVTIGGDTIFSDAELPADEFTHVSLTVENDTVSLHLNATPDVPTTIAGTLPGAGPLTFGGTSGTHSLEDVIFFTRALDTTEIGQLHLAATFERQPDTWANPRLIPACAATDSCTSPGEWIPELACPSDTPLCYSTDQLPPQLLSPANRAIPVPSAEPVRNPVLLTFDNPSGADTTMTVTATPTQGDLLAFDGNAWSPIIAGDTVANGLAPPGLVALSYVAPTGGLPGNTTEFTIELADGARTSTQTLTLYATDQVAELDTPPTMTDQAAATTTVTVTGTTWSGAPADGDTLTLNDPSGVIPTPGATTFTDGTATFTLATTDVTAGTYPLDLTGPDGVTGTAQLTVAPVADQLEITTAVGGTQGNADGSVSVSVTDRAGDPYANGNVSLDVVTTTAEPTGELVTTSNVCRTATNGTCGVSLRSVPTVSTDPNQFAAVATFGSLTDTQTVTSVGPAPYRIRRTSPTINVQPDATQPFSVTVLDGTGSPMAGVPVTFTSGDPATYLLSDGDVSGTRVTGSDGIAAVGVTADEFATPGLYGDTAALEISAGSAPATYAPVRIFVPVDTLTGPTISLAAGNSQDISVQATSSANGGQPVEGVVVAFTATAGAGLSLSSAGTTDADGVATTTLAADADASGTANLTAEVLDANGDVLATTILPITIVDTDLRISVTGTAIQQGRGALTLTATTPQGPAANVGITVTAIEDHRGNEPDLSAAPTNVVTNSDGIATVQVTDTADPATPDGRYRLVADVDGDTFVLPFTVRQIPDQLISDAATMTGTDRRNITVVVLDPNGDPVANAPVVATSDTPNITVGSARTDQRGVATIVAHTDGVPAGSYQLSVSSRTALRTVPLTIMTGIDASGITRLDAGNEPFSDVPITIGPNGQSSVTVCVSDSAGNPTADVGVAITTSSSQLTPDPSSALTDTAGCVDVTFTADGLNSGSLLTATVKVGAAEATTSVEVQ